MLDILQRVSNPPETLLETIYNNSEGNPLYIEELVKMMVEDGVILKGDDVWEVESNRLLQQRVPPTLAGIIQARLERLSKSELHTIQCASVIGRVFWNDAISSLFCSVHSSSPALATENLTALQKKEWIYPHPTTAFAGTKEYIFKHIFFREAAYDQLLKSDRQIYHYHAAEWLIQKSTDRADEYAGLIAGHFEQAGETNKAGVWYIRAGDHARNAYANETAIRYYQKSLDFSEELADRIALLEKIGRLLGRLTRTEEAIAVFQNMLSLSQMDGYPKRQIDALLHLSRSEEQLGNHPAALAHTENAEEIMLNLTDPDPYKWAEILHRKGWVHYRSGQMELAYACANEGLEITRDLENRELTAKILNLLGAIYVYRGVYPLATDYYEQSLAIHRDLENHLDESIMLVNLGEIHRLNGDFGKAISRYKEGIEIARNIDNRELLRLALSNLGGAQVGLGDWAAALETIQQVLDEVDEHWVLLSETYRFFCEAHLGGGDLEASLSAAREAWRLANGSGNPELLGNAWRILGLVAVRLGEPISPAQGKNTRYTPAEYFARSVEVLTEGGVERDRALALWDWACYEMAYGDREKGKTMWAEAQRVFEYLEMPLLVEKMDLCLTEPSGHLLHGGSHA
jgi:tetratricopeptide (TPR) repeat protein